MRWHLTQRHLTQWLEHSACRVQPPGQAGPISLLWRASNHDGHTHFRGFLLQEGDRVLVLQIHASLALAVLGSGVCQVALQSRRMGATPGRPDGHACRWGAWLLHRRQAQGAAAMASAGTRPTAGCPLATHPRQLSCGQEQQRVGQGLEIISAREHEARPIISRLPGSPALSDPGSASSWAAGARCC